MHARESKQEGNQITFLGDFTSGILENLKKLLPTYTADSDTNHGDTTAACSTESPLEKDKGNILDIISSTQGKKNIPDSQIIVLSMGDDGFYDFLTTMYKSNKQLRTKSMLGSYQQMVAAVTKYYVAILESIRDLNKTARIILMTQHYPSCSMNKSHTYEMMKELGTLLNLGGPHCDPITVLHDFMKLTYRDAIGQMHDNNIIVADITSSLDPYDSSNYADPVGLSGTGETKVARMLQYLITSTNRQVRSNFSYRFFPEFFTANDPEYHVAGSPLYPWEPAHPNDFKVGYTATEEKIFREHKAHELSDEQLLTQLENALDKKNALYNSVFAIVEEGRKLAPKITSDQTRSFKMSIVLTLNLVKNSNDERAIHLLQAHAIQSAIGKENFGKRFISVILMLTGATLLSLSVAAIPFSGGASLIGMYVAGSLLAAGGAGLFYNGRQKSLANKLSSLTQATQEYPSESPGLCKAY